MEATDKKSQHEKTRHLSMFNYLNQLQIEYLIAEFRKKIYPSMVDKDYWNGVMELKKEKIVDIAAKNHLPTIFDSKEVKLEKYNELYPIEGFPNIWYRPDNEEEAEKQKYLDKRYYYARGCEVKILEGNKILIGTIKDVDFINEKISVLIQGKSSTPLSYPINKITRIL